MADRRSLSWAGYERRRLTLWLKTEDWRRLASECSIREKLPVEALIESAVRIYLSSEPASDRDKKIREQVKQIESALQEAGQ